MRPNYKYIEMRAIKLLAECKPPLELSYKGETFDMERDCFNSFVEYPTKNQLQVNMAILSLVCDLHDDLRRTIRNYENELDSAILNEIQERKRVYTDFLTFHGAKFTLEGRILKSTSLVRYHFNKKAKFGLIEGGV